MCFGEEDQHSNFSYGLWTSTRWPVRWLPVLEHVSIGFVFWKFLTGFVKPEENSRVPWESIDLFIEGGPDAFLFKMGHPSLT